MIEVKNLKTEELIEQYYDTEYTIEDMMSTPNLQENFDDEGYQNELDEFRNKRKLLVEELKARDLECMIAYCQADLHP